MKTAKILAITGLFIAGAFAGGTAAADVISSPAPAEAQHTECGPTDRESGIVECPITIVGTSDAGVTVPRSDGRFDQMVVRQLARVDEGWPVQEVQSPRIVSATHPVQGGQCGLTDRDSGIVECDIVISVQNNDRTAPWSDGSFMHRVDRQMARVNEVA